MNQSPTNPSPEESSPSSAALSGGSHLALLLADVRRRAGHAFLVASRTSR